MSESGAQTPNSVKMKRGGKDESYKTSKNQILSIVPRELKNSCVGPIRKESASESEIANGFVARSGA